MFQAGFNGSVVDNKWPDIEAACNGFEPRAIAMQSDDDLDVLVKNPRVIRQWKKLSA